MDNNPTSPATPVNSAPTDPGTAANILNTNLGTSAPNVPVEPVKKGGYPLKWVIIIVVVLTLIGGGVYGYLNFLAPKPATNEASQSTSTGEDDIKGLSSDLNSTDPGSVDDDFKSVDADLGNL